MNANRPASKLAQNLTIAALAAVVASCSGQQATPGPTVVPTVPQPIPSPGKLPPPSAADWRDAPQTAGTWRWRETAAVSQAEFGTDPATPLFAISCARATRLVSLIRTGEPATAGPLQVSTTGPARVLQASVVAGSPPAIGAALTAQDPLLDAITFSRGRFMIEAAGRPALYLPSWPEIGRAVEDCR